MSRNYEGRDFKGLPLRSSQPVGSFTPLHISTADKVGGNECKGNVTMRITNAQRCNKGGILREPTVPLIP